MIIFFQPRDAVYQHQILAPIHVHNDSDHVALCDSYHASVSYCIAYSYCILQPIAK